MFNLIGQKLPSSTFARLYASADPFGLPAARLIPVLRQVRPTPFTMCVDWRRASAAYTRSAVPNMPDSSYAPLLGPESGPRRLAPRDGTAEGHLDWAVIWVAPLLAARRRLINNCDDRPSCPHDRRQRRRTRLPHLRHTGVTESVSSI
ncbi:hypothetical protein AAHC03_05667 [Spirometra sp. Aus1]